MKERGEATEPATGTEIDEGGDYKMHLAIVISYIDFISILIAQFKMQIVFYCRI